MAEDQSVVGRRRIYYGLVGNEALICSESDEEIAEPEEEKHVFSQGEDQLIWKLIQEHGLNREVLNVLCQFIDGTPSEIEERSEALFEKNEKHSASSDKTERHLSLEKTIDVVLDSFDNLFCRRCLSEKQPYSFELDENKKPCGDQCYLRRRGGFQDLCSDGPDASATHNTKSRTATEERGIPFSSESEDSNEDNMKSTAFVGISRPKVASSETAGKSTMPYSRATSDTENISTEIPIRSLGKRKISKHGSISQELEPSDHYADKKQKRSTSDISLASENIRHRRSIQMTAVTGLDSGDNQLHGQTLDNSSKNTLNKDICVESRSSMTEDESKDASKVSSAKNLFSSTKEQVLSRWSNLERDLCLKGIEIFGKNSCLIARNLLSGLKTCMEVANYMYNNGAAMPSRPLLTQSSLGDFREADQEYMEQDMAARTRICR